MSYPSNLQRPSPARWSFRPGHGLFPGVAPEAAASIPASSPGESVLRKNRHPAPQPGHDRVKLSIIILTFNEEHNISGVLESARFADEILVVDSCSTDRTRELALMHDVVFLQRPFDNFLEQRLFAARQATHDMIFFLDADERISGALQQDLQKVLASGSVRAAYKVAFRHHFMGRFVRENGFRESWKLRLFDRTRCGFRKDVLVHEQGVTHEGRVGKLPNPIWHFTYTSWEQFTGKKARYARLKALEYHRQGVRPNLYHFVAKPFWRFIHQYLIRGGFLYGLVGFVGAATNAYFVLLAYVNLWLLRQGNTQPGGEKPPGISAPGSPHLAAGPYFMSSSNTRET